jgi:hypothetical protein
MLRIANYYESRLGRNDGNPLYVQGCLKRMQYYGSILRKLPIDGSLLGWFSTKNLDSRAEKAAKDLFEARSEAVEVDHIYPVGDISPFGTYDLNIHVDWGEDGLKGVLPYEPFETPKPFAYWASDTHITTTTTDSYDYRLSVARKADFAFVAQKDAVERMKKDGVANPIWLPHAVEPLAYPKFDLLTKKYDVSFVGHVNSKNRIDALDRLFSEFPNFYFGQQLFENAARKFAETKVCFNIAMTNDVNMRNFEIMATGSFLLTSYLPDFEDLGLIDGEHLVLYRNLDEMVDKVRYYLAHDDEREKIAQAGYEQVIAKHTIQHRVSAILEQYLKSRQTKEVSCAGV